MVSLRKTKKSRKSKNSGDELYLPEEKKNEYANYEFHVPQQEVELMPAPLWRRTAAFIVDMVFVYFVFFQIFLRIYLPMAGIPAVTDASLLRDYMAINNLIMIKLVISLVVFCFIALFYFMLCETEFSTTLGKKLFRLKIVSKKRRLGYGQTFVRNLTKTIFIPFIFLDIIPFFISKERRRFLENLADTQVVFQSKLKIEYGGVF